VKERIGRGELGLEGEGIKEAEALWEGAAQAG
jgi:hypothetical protein